MTTETTLRITISGSPQAIKALEDLLDDQATFDKLAGAITQATSKELSEMESLQGKRIDGIEVRPNPVVARLRYMLKYNEWLNNAGKDKP